MVDGIGATLTVASDGGLPREPGDRGPHRPLPLPAHIAAFRSTSASARRTPRRPGRRYEYRVASDLAIPDAAWFD